MNIIVGLGNPGENYKNTRHNAGFMAVDFLVEKKNLTWSFNKKFNAQIACAEVELPIGSSTSEKTIYAKPQTLMNNSGQAVQAILSYYKLLPKKSLLPSWLGGAGGGLDLSQTLTVIHDDIDIELGKYKISIDSRSAGHQGVESIINHLKTKNFKRIRVGTRTKNLDKIPPEKFVLQKFEPEELKIINQVIAEIVQLI